MRKWTKSSKSISKTFENEAKNLEGWFLGILFGALGVSLLVNNR